MKKLKRTLCTAILSCCILSLSLPAAAKPIENLNLCEEPNEMISRPGHIDWHTKSQTIINAPIDSRPISNESLEALVRMGGDDYIGVDKSNLDKGPDPSNPAIFQFGNSEGVRSNLFLL